MGSLPFFTDECIDVHIFVQAGIVLDAKAAPSALRVVQST